MGHARWTSWIAGIHLLILAGDTQAAVGTSTVYARTGETATLSWDLPTPGLQTFRVSVTEEYLYRLVFGMHRKRVTFLVTNYNTVTVMNGKPVSKMEFVGHITPSGRGVFSFKLHDLNLEDGGHYRCYRPSSIGATVKVPGCGQTLVVLDFQQPYIAAPDTALLDKSVTLSCYSIFRVYPLVYVNVSIIWKRNGLLLDETPEYKITQESPTWDWGLEYHRSTLTVSDVSTAKGDNIRCEALLGTRVMSGLSEAYALVEQTASYRDYTAVREGHKAYITWKMSLADEGFFVRDPEDRRFFAVNPPWIYIFSTYHLRVNITKVTTLANAVNIEFLLHHATSRDAGKYYCSTRHGDPIPNCHHMLYVQGKPAHPSISVVVNTNYIVLTCDTNSSIVPMDHDLRITYTWQRNGQEVEDGERFHLSAQTLAVTEVKKEDLGIYSCQATEEGLASNWSDAVDLHILANTPGTSLPLVAVSSAAAVIVTLAIITGVILSRLNQLRDYWNLRFRSYITPMQNMPENIDDREYAEIEDDDLPGRGAGNIVQPVVNLPDDSNIPPACSARKRRDGQQMESEDDGYEEVRPLGAVNREEHEKEQDRRIDMQPDTKIMEDIKDEIIGTLPGSHTHSEPMIVVADWSAEGRVSANTEAAIVNQFAETSFSRT